MNLQDAFDMLARGETPKQYNDRISKLRKLTIERDFLLDKLTVLGDDCRSTKTQNKLNNVLTKIEKLK